MIYENLKNAFKDAILEAMFEFDQYKKKRKRNINPDLISTSEAYSIRGRARVTKLIEGGYLKQTASGNAPNSAKYVSKKKLLDLDKLSI